MKPSLILPAVLLALPAPASRLADAGLEFRPQEGWKLTYTMTQSAETELVEEESVLLIDGEEQDGDDATEMEITSEFELVVEFVDEYLAVEDGRPAELRRTFSDFSGEQSTRVQIEEDFDETTSGDFYSPLEDLSVVFTWDADDEEYAVEYDGEEGDEELLAELDVDASLTWFLYEGEVDEGETWDAGVEAWRALYDIGGEMAIDVGSDEELDEEDEAYLAEQEEQEDELERQMLDNAEGEVLCTYAGTRDVDGRELCVITIEAEVEGEAEEEGSYEDEEGDEIETRAWTRQTYEFEGELLWDADRGRAHSLSLRGPLEYEMVDSESFESEEGTIEFQSRERYAVEMRIEITIE